MLSYFCNSIFAMQYYYEDAIQFCVIFMLVRKNLVRLLVPLESLDYYKGEERRF